MKCIQTRVLSGLCLFTIAAMLAATPATAQEDKSTPPSTESKPDLQKLHQDFASQLSGSKLVGQFTVTGRENSNLTSEEYHIKSVEKSGDEDLWNFQVRIKYGDNDYSIPLLLKVLWAGDTPVITLTNVKIFGQGPFSARVVIYENKYAGTWSHGEVGGHLFGTIVPNAAEGVVIDPAQKTEDK